MLHKFVVQGARLVLGSLVIATTFLTAAAQEPAGSIHGLVFADLNGNGSREDGEPGVEGVAVQLTNGDQALVATTAAEGAFALEVGPGLWRVTVTPPDGYEISETGQSEIETGGEAAEATLEVGLRPIETEVAVAEDELPVVESPAGLEAELLPESGARLPLIVWVLGGFSGLLVAGLTLTLVGHLAGRR